MAKQLILDNLQNAIGPGGQTVEHSFCVTLYVSKQWSYRKRNQKLEYKCFLQAELETVHH